MCACQPFTPIQEIDLEALSGLSNSAGEHYIWYRQRQKKQQDSDN